MSNVTPITPDTERDAQLAAKEAREARERAEWVQGLRDIADFAEAHPDSPLFRHAIKLYGFCYGDNAKEKLATEAKAMGKAEKTVDDTYFNVTRRFGPHKYEASAPREAVCERKVVGTRRVEARFMEAREAQVIPAHDEEIVEWICPPSLLG